MEPTKRFIRDLEELGDEKFEQLVFAIVRKQHPHAEKTKAPDFGPRAGGLGNALP